MLSNNPHTPLLPLLYTHKPPNKLAVCPPLWNEASVIMSVNVKTENNKSEKLREWQYIAWIMCRLSDNLVTNF